MLLSAQLYDILFNNQRQHSNNDKSIQLTMPQLMLIDNAIAVSNLIKEIEKVKLKQCDRQMIPLYKLDLLKTLNTSSSKLYNWNIIIECLNQMQFQHHITTDIKQHILMGDYEVIEELLHDIFQGYQKLLSTRPDSSRQRFTPPINGIQTQRLDSKSKRLRNNSTHVNKSDGTMIYSSSLNKSQIAPIQQRVDILNVSKDPSHATSPLELFLSILERRLQLNPKEVISLFSDNNKYLAHIVAKGLKGIFEPIIQYYEEIMANIERLAILCDEKSLSFSLQALKPGLISKSSEVAQITINVLSVLQSHLESKQLYHLQEQFYNWLVEQGGFQTILLNLRRHPQLKYDMVSLIITLSKRHFDELFIHIIKEQIKNEGERIQFISSIFSASIFKQQIKQELYQLGVIDNWIDLVQKSQQLGDTKISSVKLICLIWRHYAEFVDSDRQVKFLQLLRSVSKIEQQNIVICCVLQIFQLFTYFAENKSPNAPTIYKSIAILLIEIFHMKEVRIFMLNNLEQIISNIPNIPISVIIEPLIKQIQQLSTPCLGVLKFLVIITTKKLSSTSTFLILDFLAKLTLYDIIFYRITKLIFIRLLNQELSIQNQLDRTIEFITKYTKVALQIYFVSLTKKNKQKDFDLIESQKRAQIIDILQTMILFQNQELNQIISNLLCYSYLQMSEGSRSTNKGLVISLRLLGEPEQIVTQYQDQIKLQKTPVEDGMMQLSVPRSKSNVEGNKNLNIIKLSKEQQYHLASLRKPQNINPKIQSELENAKQYFIQKVQSKADQMERGNLIETRQKQNLRKQLELRGIEQGIAQRNKTDVSAILVFPDGYLKTQIIRENNNEFQVIDLNEEEDRDQTMIDMIFQRYNKAIRFLFLKFANSGFTLNQPISFEALFKKNQSINIAEILRILQEYEIDKRISKEELIKLGRDIHVKLLREKSYLTIFDFRGFKNLLVQISIFLEEKVKFKPKQTPPFLCLQQMMDHIRSIIASRNQSTALFDDPDIQYFDQQDIIKEFNKSLDVDPQYQLPQGFKSFSVLDIKFDYSLSQNLQIANSSRIAYEIVNYIIKQLGTQIIEPISNKNMIKKARPITFIQQKIQTPSITQNQTPKRDLKQREKQSPTQQRKAKRDLTIGLKMELSKFNKDRSSAEEVANLLDDMQFAIQYNRTDLDRSNKLTTNRVQELKYNILSQQLKLKDLQDKKRLIRHGALRQKLEQDRILNQQKIKILNEQKKLNKDIQNEDQQTSFRLKQVYAQELKSKIKSNQDKQQEKFAKMCDDAKLLKIEEIQKKKKEFIKFNQIQISQFNKEIVEEKLRKASQIQKTLKEDGKKIKKFDKMRQCTQARDIQINLAKQLVSAQLFDRFNSLEYQSFFNDNKNQLTQLFEFLILETFYPIGRPASRDQIPIKMFMWFADKFKIWPEILNINELTSIYRTLTRDKIMVDLAPVGMNYNEFQQAIFRISVKGKKIFNNIDLISPVKDFDSQIQDNQNINVDKQQQSQTNIDNIDIYDKNLSIDLQNKLDGEDKEDIQDKYIQDGTQVDQENIKYRNHSPKQLPLQLIDIYGNIDEANFKTLQALVQYLNLPEDKNELDKRFRQILEEKKQPNKQRMALLKGKLQD